jgi:PAS domain S-box-containing protein
LALIVSPFAAGQAPKGSGAAAPMKRVFVLCSFNQGYAWTDNMLQGIKDAFAASGIAIDQYVDFMDMKRIPYSDEYFSCFKDLLAVGYRGVAFDLVLACDNDAFNFMRRYRDELFPGVPEIFVSLNDYSDEMLDGRSDITGTSENTDYAGTISTALDLLPNARRIVVVTDGTTTGLAHRSAIGKIEARFADRASFEYLSLADSTLGEMVDTLSRLPSTSAVLLAQHFRDRDGQTYSVDESTPILTARCSVPCFAVADIRMGLGALGGDVVSGYYHGKAAAEMAVSILSGKDVKSIPVLKESANKYMFDYRVLRRFGISEKKLPAGSIIIGKPENLFVKYRTQSVGVLAGFAIVIVFMVILGLEILRRRRLEKSLVSSESRLRTALENAPFPMMIHAEDGTVEMINAAWEELTGYAPQDIPTTAEWTAKAYGERKDTVQKDIDALYGIEGRDDEGEYRVRTADGRTLIWDFSSAALGKMPDGRRLVLSMAKDVTERIKYEEEILESRRRLELAATSAHLGIWDWDVVENRIVWDDQMFRIYGITERPAECGVEIWRKNLHPDDAERTQRESQDALDGKMGYDTEFRILHPDGSIRHVKADGIVLRDQAGKPLRMIGINRDITAQKVAETEHRNLEQQIQQNQKLESLGILAGGIAHDFNNLMGGIFGYIDLAMGKTKEKEVSSFLSSALATMERARGLTRQLLTFSKGGDPVKCPTGLFPFISDTVKFAMSGSTSVVSFKASDGLWPCDVDKNQIGQVFDNLTINAVQAMPEGGSIAVEAENIDMREGSHSTLAPGRYVRVSVADQGIGIPKEILPRIFDPFYSTKAKGHGLGLATAYSIVKRHSGLIEVESEPGRGSVFSVYLPASAKAPAEEPGEAPPHSGTGRIILMDDEEVIRIAIGGMLSALGYTVLEVKDGKEAVELFAAERARGIVGMIFDFTVPGGKGGVEAVAEIRKLDSAVPVIVSSGYAEDPVMLNPKNYGFTSSIAKPFKKTDLSALLESLIRSPGSVETGKG